MSSLPKQLPWEMAQDRWATALDPVIANPLVQGQLLEGLVLTSGANTINHKLGRKLRGWTVTRTNAAVTIYDTQDSNQMPQLTLSLVTSGPVTVSLWVF